MSQSAQLGLYEDVARVDDLKNARLKFSSTLSKAFLSGCRSSRACSVVSLPLTVLIARSLPSQAASSLHITRFALAAPQTPAHHFTATLAPARPYNAQSTRFGGNRAENRICSASQHLLRPRSAFPSWLSARPTSWYCQAGHIVDTLLQ